jgi:carbon-monoxide dehydrogenase medium subunit
VKAARFDYRRPKTLAEALDLLAEADGSAKAMAGGQSLGPMLNLRLARPSIVVDISAVPELRGVTAADGGLQVGAGVTHAQLEDGWFAPLRGHPLQQVAGGIAYRAIRNRGTIGGSLAHADPAADWVVALAALGVELTLVSTRGKRRLPIDAFMLGAYTTVLAADELIETIHLPGLAAEARWGYYKFCRKTGEFAEASCAALFDASAKVARIVLGALDGPPLPLGSLAQAVARNGAAAADRQSLFAAVRSALPQRDAVDCRMHATALERCLAQALAEERSPA